ncbi:MAG: chemotaxis protein CheW [Desulfuromonadaceae bacterium]
MLASEPSKTYQTTSLHELVTPDEITAQREFLAFRLGPEEYGVDALKVQEIRGYGHVTLIPNAVSFVKGVVNLRGLILPIVDMRIKLGLGQPTYDYSTVVVILNIHGRLSGIVVDSVSDVLTLLPNQITHAPDCESVIAAEYVIGLGSVGERMLILLDIDKLMVSDEMALMDRNDN